MLHVDLIMLHVDIIYLACRGQKYTTMQYLRHLMNKIFLNGMHKNLQSVNGQNIREIGEIMAVSLV